MDAAIAAEVSQPSAPDDGVPAVAEHLHPSPPLPRIQHRSPENLVAKAIAPVKVEYLRPPPLRTVPNSEVEDGAHDGAAERKAAPGLVKEKKSKRQLKKERKQVDVEKPVSFFFFNERKSALHICPEVAKSGNVDACRFGGSCRFNHDLEAFMAQKPADLEGICPFVMIEELCPYGITCRYMNTHKKHIPLSNPDILRKSFEVNTLNKDLQKLLWKNEGSFPVANAQLKALGLKEGKSRVANSGNGQLDSHQDISNGSDGLQVDDSSDACCISGNEKLFPPCKTVKEERLGDASVINVCRPLKKVKYEDHDNIEVLCTSESSNGEKKIAFATAQNRQEVALSISMCSTKADFSSKSQAREKKLIDFRGKLYLAPLTTVGNLPFRRVCKALGADITCGEMAVCSNLLQGQASEWALLRRHSSEDIFGVQICGAYPDTVARTVELIDQQCTVDFIDINMGCPIDVIVNKGAGSSLLMKPMRMKGIIQVASGTTERPLTIKARSGFFEGRNQIDSLISNIYLWGANAVTVHGRSRQQRYSKLADWNYIYQCAGKAPSGLQFLGNGDIFSYCDYNKHISDCPQLSTCMIARGALLKPWIFTEIKEQRHWDISSGERLNILKDFVNFGLEHWGSDTKGKWEHLESQAPMKDTSFALLYGKFSGYIPSLQLLGVETTRHFLLEWLSYTHRYIPTGLLDVIPQCLNWRPPSYFGRDDLETIMASDCAADWIRISEMLLGKVPEGFTFAPKHKSNAYDHAENG
ncbi:tRNA-dihydrouridine(47) synthase [NAD(P)(+)]-like [Apostasia shenzhenica]|uniref:tRNA-dihydrouridine(47) synthase [NAD(P)(+)] n=1 Tax=Apostasia shenzhenica TaxID=1088818 RepID=A0A2I0AC35_9ASPA|nr:tRNA-dihydrouridine(47) synthase [NAD(P)(+)]-like [Apostasia shenzhenica]